MKTDDNIQTLMQNNPFMQLLAQLASGRTMTVLAEKYPQLVAAVKSTGKKGELVLKLTVKPDGRGEEGEVETVEVHDEVKIKVPERDRKPTIFFVTSENMLERSNPKQPELPFSQSAAATAAAKKS